MGMASRLPDLCNCHDYVGNSGNGHKYVNKVAIDCGREQAINGRLDLLKDWMADLRVEYTQRGWQVDGGNVWNTPAGWLRT